MSAVNGLRNTLKTNVIMHRGKQLKKKLIRKSDENFIFFI